MFYWEQRELSELERRVCQPSYVSAYLAIQPRLRGDLFVVACHNLTIFIEHVLISQILILHKHLIRCSRNEPALAFVTYAVHWDTWRVSNIYRTVTGHLHALALCCETHYQVISQLCTCLLNGYGTTIYVDSTHFILYGFLFTTYYPL